MFIYGDWTANRLEAEKTASLHNGWVETHYDGETVYYRGVWEIPLGGVL